MQPANHRVRITARIEDFLSGTGAYQAVTFSEPGDTSVPAGESQASMTLMRKIYSTISMRRDRAITVYLTAEEASLLCNYVGAMEAGAADNTWDPDGRADLAAARACLRQLTVLGVTR